jgi:hypothetical protein
MGYGFQDIYDWCVVLPSRVYWIGREVLQVRYNIFAWSYGVSPNSTHADCNIFCRVRKGFVAFVFIVVFQLCRAIFINVLIVINAKLPSFLESAYFAQFAVQTMFFFYYRNLFITFSGKYFDVFSYPVRLAVNSYFECCSVHNECVDLPSQHVTNILQLQISQN